MLLALARENGPVGLPDLARALRPAARSFAELAIRTKHANLGRLVVQHEDRAVACNLDTADVAEDEVGVVPSAGAQLGDGQGEGAEESGLCQGRSS